MWLWCLQTHLCLRTRKFSLFWTSNKYYLYFCNRLQVHQIQTVLLSTPPFQKKGSQMEVPINNKQGMNIVCCVHWTQWTQHNIGKWFYFTQHGTGVTIWWYNTCNSILTAMVGSMTCLSKAQALTRLPSLSSGLTLACTTPGQRNAKNVLLMSPFHSKGRICSQGHGEPEIITDYIAMNYVY